MTREEELDLLDEEDLEVRDVSHVDTDAWRAAAASSDPVSVPDEVWLTLTPAVLVPDIRAFKTEEAARGYIGAREHIVLAGPFKFMGQRRLFG